MRVAVVGGGAAGFFFAINLAERKPDAEIHIFESQSKLLSKVKVSGGGRCNVTNAEFVPKELSKNYPRGQKALLGPFNKFCTGDTMEWFENNGVPLKIEDDGRIFPESDASQSIIDCFLNKARKHKVSIHKSAKVNIVNLAENSFELEVNGETLQFDRLMLATGSNSATWKKLGDFGFEIIPTVPSLFSFHIPNAWFLSLAGLSFKQASVKVLGTKFKEYGPMIITHKGLSGPAVLKTSAYAARELADRGYKFTIAVDFLNVDRAVVLDDLNDIKATQPRKLIGNARPSYIPQRMWTQLLSYLGVSNQLSWANIRKKEVILLVDHLVDNKLDVAGKSPNKEEFVTAGGVNLKEINFKHFESKKFKGLYLAGEMLDIDAVTGGFNFQAAWTGAWIAAQSIE